MAANMFDSPPCSCRPVEEWHKGVFLLWWKFLWGYLRPWMIDVIGYVVMLSLSAPQSLQRFGASSNRLLPSQEPCVNSSPSRPLNL
jgi:hypothetical protein